MINTAIYNFPEHVSGTTFGGLKLNMQVDRNGVVGPLDLTGAVISLVFGENEHELSTTNGGITIDTPETGGTFTIVPTLINWRKDRYKYVLTITLNTGDTSQYVTGIWKIS